MTSSKGDRVFIRRPQVDPNYWKTKDDRVVKITDMETSHIRNCIALMLLAPGWRKEHMGPMVKELQRRDNKEKVHE